MSRRIIELRAENFKRLRAVCIRPDGDIVQITERNRQGKTSMLDAFWAGRADKFVTPDAANPGGHWGPAEGFGKAEGAAPREGHRHRSAEGHHECNRCRRDQDRLRRSLPPTTPADVLKGQMPVCYDGSRQSVGLGLRLLRARRYIALVMLGQALEGLSADCPAEHETGDSDRTKHRPNDDARSESGRSEGRGFYGSVPVQACRDAGQSRCRPISR